MLKKLSMKTKLLILVMFSSVMLAVMSLGGWYSLNDLKVNMDRVTQLSVPKLSHLSNMRYFGSEVTRLFLRVTTAGLSEKEVTRLKGKLEEHVTLYETSEALYLKMPFEEGEKELYTTQDTKWDETVVLIREGVILIGKTDEVSIERLQNLNSTLVAKSKVGHNDAFQFLQDFQTKKSEEWRADADKSAGNGRNFLLILSGLGISLNVIGGILFAQYLARVLISISARLNREAVEVRAAAESIATTSVQISSGATEQAASLEQTAASMNEITAMVSNSASSAKKSRLVASESQIAVSTGKDVMQDLLGAITDIDQSNNLIMSEVANSNQQIGEIVSMIETIREKTKVINDIVFQTKLLSFNASVEAARAGEMGKGFAVVAEEVGKLALVSGTAAKEIGTLLSESVEKVRSTISRSQQSVGGLISSGSTKIRNGVSIATHGTEVLGSIVTNVAMMESHIAEISNAADEQAKGVDEINSAITQLDNVTQINSSAAEESAASADALKRQAQELYEIIAELNQVITGEEIKAA